MAQTKEGALKTAAKKIGITVAEYLALVDDGKKHCTKCKQWKRWAEFATDRSRYDDLAARCRLCAHAAELRR